MCEILTVPLKRGADVDLLRPLTRWIAATFSTADSPVDCTSAVSELHKMRQGVARLTDRGDAGLLAAAKYDIISRKLNSEKNRRRGSSMGGGSSFLTVLFTSVT